MEVVAAIPQSQSPICWAEYLGDCSKEGSREHIVTESTLQGPDLNVRGLPFLEGKTITLHKSQFKSNILCRRHNSDLSPVDQAATSAFDALRDAASPDPKEKNRIDGTRLERWLLKTLINFEVLADFKVRPPRDIVEIAFGRRKFGPQAGLFFLGYSFDPLLGDERVAYTRLTADGTPDKIIGGRFNFRNFELLLLLANSAFPKLQIADVKGLATEIEPMHHPRRFIFPNANFVALSWRP